MKFDKRLGSSTAETLVKCHGDRITLDTHHVAVSLSKIFRWEVLLGIDMSPTSAPNPCQTE